MFYEGDPDVHDTALYSSCWKNIIVRVGLYHLTKIHFFEWLHGRYFCFLIPRHLTIINFLASFLTFFQFGIEKKHFLSNLDYLSREVLWVTDEIEPMKNSRACPYPSNFHIFHILLKNEPIFQILSVKFPSEFSKYARKNLSYPAYELTCYLLSITIHWNTLLGSRHDKSTKVLDPTIILSVESL